MDELQKEILSIINTELLPKKTETWRNAPFYAEYTAGKIAEMVVKKFSCNLPVIDPLPSQEELMVLIREMHKYSLYKISEEDYRPTHSPLWLFDKVEKVLNNDR